MLRIVCGCRLFVFPWTHQALRRKDVIEILFEYLGQSFKTSHTFLHVNFMVQNALLSLGSPLYSEFYNSNLDKPAFVHVGHTPSLFKMLYSKTYAAHDSSSPNCSYNLCDSDRKQSVQSRLEPPEETVCLKSPQALLYWYPAINETLNQKIMWVQSWYYCKIVLLIF